MCALHTRCTLCSLTTDCCYELSTWNELYKSFLDPAASNLEMAGGAGIFICSLLLSLFTYHVCLDNRMFSEKHLKIATVSVSGSLD